MTSPMPRRLQFSLRFVLVVMAVVAVWLGMLANRAHQQRDAVAKIRALGGIAYYDYQDVSRRNIVRPVGAPTFDPFGMPASPAWLRKLLGEDFFHDVAVIDLSQTGLSQPQIMEVHASIPYAAISSPRKQGYRNVWPDRVYHYDAISLTVTLAGTTFAVWLIWLFVRKLW